jgi:DNA invertase Pin-like site-specific DNA recombinase
MIAIYARQSVDKKDSISIESQIETCKRKVLPEEDDQVKVYSDKGFSGKSTNRPDFQAMIEDIQQGLIDKIIVYKVDRISRSLLDFLTMQEDFRKYGVEFISCSEDFDTSTSTGKLMMNMLMMFAEMERESIQKRITDNYYSRGERGFYLGGYAPYGYKKIDTSLDGKKTYTFEIINEEAEIVQGIYEDYAYNHRSLNDIARTLNNKSIKTKRNQHWSMQAVSRILHNPIYVKANADIYTYLKSNGATMNNDVEEYNGIHGCYVYGNAQQRKAKFTSLENDYVTLGLHDGFIDANLWLLVQQKFRQQRVNGNLGSGKLSWAQGLVKCKHCGYSCYVKKYQNTNRGKVFKYFYCRGKRNDVCAGSRKMVRVEVIEDILESSILNRIKNSQYIESNDESDHDIILNALKIELTRIESQIDSLVSQIGQASETTMKYINIELEKLDQERDSINLQISDHQLKKSRLSQAFDFDDIIENWNEFDIEKKSSVAKSLIDSVELDGEEINIRMLV